MLTSSREGAQEEKEAEGSRRVRLVEFRRKEEGWKGQEEMSGWCHGHFAPVTASSKLQIENARSYPPTGALYNSALIVNA